MHWLHSFSKSDKSRSITICQTRPIQSGEKEHADLSSRSGRGHLVLVCAERHRPRPLLLVNRLRWHPAAQMGVAKPDFLRCIWANQVWLRTRSLSLGSI